MFTVLLRAFKYLIRTLLSPPIFETLSKVLCNDLFIIIFLYPIIIIILVLHKQIIFRSIIEHFKSQFFILLLKKIVLAFREKTCNLCDWNFTTPKPLLKLFQRKMLTPHTNKDVELTCIFNIVA